MKMFFCILWLFAASVTQAQQAELKNLSEKSLDMAVRQYLLLDRSVPDSLFPRSYESNKLITNRSTWWTSGFFPASLWYLYDYSRNPQLKTAAIKKLNQVEREKLNTGDHDIGFKIYCPFGNALLSTGDSSYIAIIVQAAQSLTKRFNSVVGQIRSWGKPDEQKDFLVIIDNMMNLELLFAATRFTADSSFYKIAVTHADNTMRNHFRPDGSSFHVVNYDQSTGKVKEKKTAQGLADSSAWSRGQSWGLYGYTVCYRETHDPKYLHMARRIASFMLTHANLPDDGIPLWDMNAQAGSPRDASAAAIMASALLELEDHVSEAEKLTYRHWIEKVLTTLSKEPYRTALNESGNFLLKHGVGHLPAKSEVDVPLSYADYYYIESLLRWRKKNQ